MSNLVKKLFGAVLSETLNCYAITDNEIINKAAQSNCAIEPSTVRHWKRGTNYPHNTNIEILFEIIKERVNNNDYTIHTVYKQRIEEIFSQYIFETQFRQVKYDDVKNYPISVLRLIYIMRKDIKKSELRPKIHENKGVKSYDAVTEAIVFDFDGTLTIGRTGRTTWESLWAALGTNNQESQHYVRQCQIHHAEFEDKKITHNEWCRITQEAFIKGGLKKTHLDNIAKEIKLIKGVQDVFQYCREHNINIYVVSGSILYVIQAVLGSLFRYVDRVTANQFRFNADDTLREIVGTKYDFIGKATFIREIATELGITTSSVLFVGNSINDEYVHLSGARTLCINPSQINSGNKEIWHNRIIGGCEDLTKILSFIKLK